ncbi:MAG: UDP-glucose 4-epimerase GalE [Acidobacteriia bacterium]|nr:UDP-glucose 4-epimerase GalE [Terriglobia bacterium]
MTSILVTGGAGYIGSACCRQLLEKGYRVTVVDDLSTGHAEAVPSGVSLHRIDIGDSDSLAAILSTSEIDAVFHFAAKALIPESVMNPGVFFDVNVARGIAMLETLRSHGIRKVVFSSTAAVYGTPTIVPIPEDHSKDPINSYGESKLVFERILQWYAAAYGWSVVAFRYFNACGGASDWGERHEPETHIIPLLLQTASGRRPIFEIHGTDYPTPDGTCLRDYVHVVDIAEAHLLALQKMDGSGFHAYNIGTGRSHSVKEICQAAESITKQKIHVRAGQRRPGDPSVLCASPKKLMDEFCWAPKHSDLDEIIAGAWEWEQTQCSKLVARP